MVTYTLEELRKMMNENGGGLDLRGTAITALPENLAVGGGLDLSGTAITELPENLTVGGGLDLSRTAITSLSENLTVGGWLDLSRTAITELPENLTVGGWLDLSGTAITALLENLTVGGGLDLSRTAITELPENLTVGGSLYLRGTAITSLSENLTVGGWLDLSGTAITEEEANKVRRPKDGEYIPGRYLYADGILTHIKQVRKIDGYTLYVGKIPGKNVVYDGTYYAHCKSLRDGISDLLFKHCEDRGAEQFKGIDPDEKHSVAELVTMYRIITGACRQGSDEFVKSLARRKKLKDMYTIREAAELTEGQYNAERFREFFGF